MRTKLNFLVFLFQLRTVVYRLLSAEGRSWGGHYALVETDLYLPGGK